MKLREDFAEELRRELEETEDEVTIL